MEKQLKISEFWYGFVYWGQIFQNIYLKLIFDDCIDVKNFWTYFDQKTFEEFREYDIRQSKIKRNLEYYYALIREELEHSIIFQEKSETYQLNPYTKERITHTCDPKWNWLEYSELNSTKDELCFSLYVELETCQSYSEYGIWSNEDEDEVTRDSNELAIYIDFKTNEITDTEWQ